ncbi:MAG: NAD(P)-binding protein [Rhodocyclales bacterium]|nr:NAD(P)-binding protein [Rhodocyclales bacterium]
MNARFLQGVLSRRAFVKLIAAGSTSLYLRPAWAGVAAPGASTATGPIDRGIGEAAPALFSGDDPRRAHRILWDKPAWLASHGGRYPVPEKRIPLLVVGGGLSGLLTAYLLRRHQPVVLEQAPRFGGNARGESWRGMDYAIGAAYFTAPEAGSPLAALYAELGVDRIWRRKSEGHPVALDGRLVEDFWQGETVPAAQRQQFRTIADYFRRLNQGEGGLAYPQIPAATTRQRAHVNALDRVSFRRHVESVLRGRRLHPHIATAFEHYCWSSFGASFSEVGAAAGLNFFAAEFGDILVTPGGNAAIAERLHERLGRHCRKAICGPAPWWRMCAPCPTDSKWLTRMPPEACAACMPAPSSWRARNSLPRA